MTAEFCGDWAESRAYAHLSSLKANEKAAGITHVCDVDETILNKFAGATQKEMGEAATPLKDFRKALESKDVDAITIASPDHWHTPMAIAGLQAGKHVYVEKPCSHNPAEGAMLVAAQKVRQGVQMGTQQRSSRHTIEVIEKIRAGEIGRPYLAKAWYSIRGSRLAWGKKRRYPQRWTGICGKDRRRGGRIAITCILITGIGSGIMGQANR